MNRLLLALFATTAFASPIQAQSVSIREFMSAAEYSAAGLAKLTTAERAALDAWFGRFVLDVAQLMADPGTGQGSPRRSGGASSFTLAQLEGASVVADDGQPLGLITTNCFQADAICNEFGRYGNEFNSRSMLNEFGRYGGEFSRLSPFNEFSSSPPQIMRNGRFLAFLTRNRAKSPRVDPLWLIGALKN